MFTKDQDPWLIDVVEYYRTRPLITEPDAQHKYALSGEGEGAVYQVGLSLAAARSSGKWNLCAGASAQCKMLCLRTAGQNQWPSNARAQLLRTRLLMEHREVFLEYLERDLGRQRAKAHKAGLRLAMRFNTLSDVDVLKLCGNLINGADIWLDYTKIGAKYRAWLANPHPQYHLTFSRSEDNHALCLEFLKLGGTVTIVVKTQADKDRLLNGSYFGYPSCDGDLSDRRWQDPKGHWVVLLAKGKARKAKASAKDFVVTWDNRRAA